VALDEYLDGRKHLLQLELDVLEGNDEKGDITGYVQLELTASKHPLPPVNDKVARPQVATSEIAPGGANDFEYLSPGGTRWPGGQAERDAVAEVERQHLDPSSTPSSRAEAAKDVMRSIGVAV